MRILHRNEERDGGARGYFAIYVAFDFIHVNLPDAGPKGQSGRMTDRPRNTPNQVQKVACRRRRVCVANRFLLYTVLLVVCCAACVARGVHDDRASLAVAVVLCYWVDWIDSIRFDSFIRHIAVATQKLCPGK